MDQRTDIYALGITVYEMLVGHRPFPEEDAQALEAMHLNHDVPDPAASVADLPKGLRHFIIKSCQRDPGLRYDDLNQVQVDLKRIAKAHGVAHQTLAAAKRKRATLMLSFEDKDQTKLQQRMEEFSVRAHQIGVDLTMPDLPEE